MRASLFLILGLIFTAGPVCADTASDAHAKMDPKMMEAMEKASNPAEQHKMLAQYAGTWSHTMSMWMSPEAAPEVTTGTSQIDIILGGRFLRQQVSGTSMGQPFEGMGITGYDTLQKHFSTMWIDNMSTGMMTGKGALRPDAKAIVDRGTFSCPLSKAGTRSYRSVWSLPVNNTFTYEMYTPDEQGKEYRMLEIKYTKAG